jgi:hypothetical protein
MQIKATISWALTARLLPVFATRKLVRDEVVAHGIEPVLPGCDPVEVSRVLRVHRPEGEPTR